MLGVPYPGGGEVVTWREEPRDWRAQANCSDLDDPEVMFPHPADEDGIAAARFVCAGCPVAITCLNEALGETDAALAADHGVFGG